MSRNWVLSVSMIRFGLASLAGALRKSFCVLRAWFQEVRSGGLSHVDADGFAKVMLTRQDCCFPSVAINSKMYLHTSMRILHTGSLLASAAFGTQS